MDMPDRSLRKGDGPVGVIFAEQSRYEEAARQLGLHRDFGARVELCHKVAFHFGAGDLVVIDIPL